MAPLLLQLLRGRLRKIKDGLRLSAGLLLLLLLLQMVLSVELLLLLLLLGLELLLLGLKLLLLCLILCLVLILKVLVLVYLLIGLKELLHRRADVRELGLCGPADVEGRAVVGC